MQTLLIAEAGVNHNGDIQLAKQLIDVAAEAGADYVKFQTFKAEKLVSKTAEKAAYQKSNTDSNETQYEMLKKLELNAKDHQELLTYCKQKDIQFLSTAFDVESIYFLKSLGISLGKVPSGEITNLPYLKEMAKNFEQLILSTGMADMQEIQDALHVLIQAGFDTKNVTVLHCNTEYPTPFTDVNLKAMQTIAKQFNVKVGYSDHTMGIEVPIAAVAMGATVIEKHFTLDRNMEGPDHKASLEPNELKQMAQAIRNIEQALGSAEKNPTNSELKNKVVARKSIIAAREIRIGEIITEADITIKRPGTGISPMMLNEVIGRKLKQNVLEDTVLDFSFFE